MSESVKVPVGVLRVRENAGKGTKRSIFCDVLDGNVSVEDTLVGYDCDITLVRPVFACFSPTAYPLVTIIIDGEDAENIHKNAIITVAR